MATKRPKLVDIRTAVRMGKIGKAYRLYQRFTGDYNGPSPMEEGCTSVTLERVGSNGLILNFFCKKINISVHLYTYSNRKLVKPYVIQKSIKNK